MKPGLHEERRRTRARAEVALAAVVESLRRARERRALSPERVGVLAGLSDRSVRMWETGHRQPGFAEVVMWAAALDFEVKVERALGDMGED